MILDDVFDKMNKQLEGVSKGEIRAANLEVLPRLVDALHKNSKTCAQCKEGYEKSILYVDDIVSVIRGSKEKRREFEHVVNDSLEHLHNDHKTLPKGKILSVSVLVGMLAGLAIAVLVGFFIDGNLMRYGALGWLLGVTSGWMIGKVRERNLKKRGRLF